VVQATDLFIRFTPVQVDLPRGAPVDFTVSITRDFGITQVRLVVRLFADSGPAEADPDIVTEPLSR
jgi:hypothetical protein